MPKGKGNFTVEDRWGNTVAGRSPVLDRAAAEQKALSISGSKGGLYHVKSATGVTVVSFESGKRKR